MLLNIGWLMGYVGRLNALFWYWESALPHCMDMLTVGVGVNCVLVGYRGKSCPAEKLANAIDPSGASQDEAEVGSCSWLMSWYV
jgi:hypothetical protein